MYAEEGKKAQQQAINHLAQPDRVEDIVMQDGLEEVVLVVRLERRLARHHLVHEDAKRPPVHTGSIVQFLSEIVLSRIEFKSSFVKHFSDWTVTAVPYFEYSGSISCVN